MLIIMKCFDYHIKNKKNCERKSCRYWIERKENKNCGLNFIKSSNQKLTLEDVGKLFNVTRMRICQIEKKAIKKVKDIFDFN